MGQSEPHRRSGLDGAAYCLSIDLVGPFPLGRDEGFNKRTKAKYILVGTVAIPKLDREGHSKGLHPAEDHQEGGEDPDAVPGEIKDLDAVPGEIKGSEAVLGEIN